MISLLVAPTLLWMMTVSGIIGKDRGFGGGKGEDLALGDHDEALFAFEGFVNGGAGVIRALGVDVEDGFILEVGGDFALRGMAGIGDGDYRLLPGSEVNADLPFYLVFEKAALLRLDEKIRVEYQAGHTQDEIPTDLALAYFKLTSWNMGRYRNKRIGMGTVVKGWGADRFEASMPENVKFLLEPYRRKVL
jgi:hypothetical protein